MFWVWSIYMKSICVYCGSAKLASEDSPGSQGHGSHARPPRAGPGVRRGPHRADGRAGRRCPRAGRQVIGVITEGMNTPELAHTRLTRLEVTATIHQRKARMYALAEGYIALPGGYGTLDELFETLTWAQIGEHAKPVGLLNVNGYYDDLLRMLDRAVREKLLFPEHRRALLVDAEPEGLLEAMEGYQAPTEAVKRWMRQE